MSRKYGDFMLLKLGSKPTLVVSSANAAKEIFKTHDLAFSNRPRSSISCKLLYNCRDIAFSNYGEYWRKMKSLCVLQLLSNTRVQSFRKMREEETALMVENIKRSSSSSLMNLSEILMTLTNDVICRAAFGRKRSEEKRTNNSNLKELLQMFVEVQGAFSVGSFIPWLGWIDRVSGLEGRVEKIAKQFDVMLEGILQEHIDDSLDTQGDGDKHGEGEKMKDFVDVLLEAQGENSQEFIIDRVSIKAIILDMFVAGTDTSYTGLEWAMSELLRHPKVMKQLQEEVRRITQGRISVIEDELEQMKYLKAVIKETLRLHPPVPLLVSRESSKDVEIYGYNIAAKTQVIINAWAIQRDPEFWEEPNKFCPERFLDSAVDFRGQDFQLIPFGAGRRSCPGISFASVITELVLANLVYAFDWTMPVHEVKCEALDMKESTGTAIHRRDPLLAIATPYCC
ncbi:Cytochrome P450 71A25 [Bienertia sinuspersici]